MKRPLKNTTYEDAVCHAHALFDELKETEEYAAVVTRAEELGVTITMSPRHTYTEDFVVSYYPHPIAEGQLPTGYAMELWFDITRGGRVLMTGGDTPLQCSYGARAIEMTSFLFINRLKFHPLSYVLEHNPICEMLEEFLDGIAEETTESPFTTDALAPTSPRGGAGIITRGEVAEGDYTEFSRHAYDGNFGYDDSLYLAADATLPYRLFLLALTGRTTDFEGTHLSLDNTIAESFADLLEEIPASLRRCATYTDVLSDLCESPLAPTPRAEQLLDGLTVCRAAEFAKDAKQLAALIREQIALEAPVTVIW